MYSALKLINECQSSCYNQIVAARNDLNDENKSGFAKKIEDHFASNAIRSVADLLEDGIKMKLISHEAPTFYKCIFYVTKILRF